MKDVAAQPKGSATELLKALPVGNKRLLKVMTVLATAQQIWRGLNTFYTKVQNDREYVISVPGDDEIYADVHSWVLANLTEEKRRAMVVRSTKTSFIYEPTSKANPGGKYRAIRPTTSLKMYFDGTRTQTVNIGGYDVAVAVEKPDAQTSGRDGWQASFEKVVFTTSNTAGRDAIVAWLEEIALKRVSAQPKIKIANRWGGWQTRMSVPKRELSTVVLRRGQLDALLADMKNFLSTEQAYAKLGLPWHRGYLFHGLPGTGKTSIATALASEFGLDVHSISLGSLESDGSLTDALCEVEPRSMLLIEDVDVAHAARERDDDAGVSLAGLLNGLDGMTTPHGLITVMTTNHRELLDSALVRPGRVDVDEEVLPCDDDQVQDLCNMLLGHDVPVPLLDGRLLTPAQVVGVFKQNLDGEADVKGLLAEMIANLPITTA